MGLDKIIKERHSVRKFSSKKPNWRDIMQALDSARLSPLAGNISAIRFILVSDREKIRQLAEASQQDFSANAEYVVVFCSDTSDLERSYGERGKVYARQQAGASIENFLLKLTELGLSTCWIGAFYDEGVKYILGIPEHIEVEAFFPIGYELGKSKQRFKAPLDTITFFDRWKQKKMGGEIKPWS